MQILRFAAACGVAATVTSTAFAQDVTIRHLYDTREASTLDISKAKPIPRKGEAQATKAAESATASAEASDLVPGSIGGGNEAKAGRAHGTFGIPYTSTRVKAGLSTSNSSSPNYLATTYPYRAIGALFFTDGAGTYHCSASVIRRGVIVTAAHCVQEFGAGAAGRYANHRFVPAYYGVGTTTAQQRPYGTWTGRTIALAPQYVSGTDTGNGSAVNNDVAVIALAKLNNRFIGDVVGKLGYGWNNYGFVRSPKTGNLWTASVSTLGYPGLLDGGEILQRTDGPTYQTVVSSALQYWQGSDFTGGSSGGPWVVNFYSTAPVRTGGGQAGNESERYVVGVTSWGSADPNDVKDNYSSRFGQNREFPAANYGGRGAGNIGALMDALCQRTVPGAGRTFAEAGYCD